MVSTIVKWMRRPVAHCSAAITANSTPATRLTISSTLPSITPSANTTVARLSERSIVPLAGPVRCCSRARRIGPMRRPSQRTPLGNTECMPTRAIQYARRVRCSMKVIARITAADFR
ncbi:hypothetical protein RLIN73S_01781 [Rhodanobacter lindaniclasticus]